MLKYGEAYLALNDQALERMYRNMSPAAVALAREIAADEMRQDANEDEQ